MSGAIRRVTALCPLAWCLLLAEQRLCVLAARLRATGVVLASGFRSGPRLGRLLR